MNAPRHVRAPTEDELRRLIAQIDERTAVRGDDVRRNLLEPDPLVRATAVIAVGLALFVIGYFALQFLRVTA